MLSQTQALHRSNTKKAVTFLKTMFPGKRVNVTVIDPDTKVVTAITRHVDSEDIPNFIEQNNGKGNIYYSVNTPADDAPDNKLKKEHIKEINAVWIDADPVKCPKGADAKEHFAQERKRLYKFAEELARSDNPPTVITDSGGGIQAFWMLDKPVPVTDKTMHEYEALSRGLSEQYGTDNVQNIDRIMRIPYTWNMPTDKKKNQGRKKALARYKKTGNPYTPDQLHGFIKPSYAVDTGADSSHIELNGLGLTSDVNIDAIPDTLKDKIIHGVPDDDDRSKAFYHVICVLQNMRFSVDSIYSLLAAYPNGIAKKYAQRKDLRAQVEKCFSKAIAANAISNDFSQIKEKLISSSSFISVGEATWQDSGVPLYKYFMNRETVAVMYGPSNSGKSFLVLDYALHLATGLDWAGYKCKKKMAVLYICAESGSSFGKRVVAARRKLGLSENVPLHEIPFAYYTARLDLLNNKEHLKKIEQLIDELEKVSGFKCGLVVIDTLSAAFGGGNENSEDMTKFVNNMADIKFSKKVTPLIIHHEGKNKNAEARGHSSLKCNIDTEIKVSSIDDNKGTFQSTKQRDDEKGKPSKFCRQVVPLGQDDDGDNVTSCAVYYNTDDFIDSHFDDTDEFDGNHRAALLTVQAFQEPEFLQWCLGKKNKDIRELMIKHWLLIIKNSNKTLSLQQLLKAPLRFNYNNKSGQFQKCFDKVKHLFDNPKLSLKQWIEQNLVNISQALLDQKEQEAI